MPEMKFGIIVGFSEIFNMSVFLIYFILSTIILTKDIGKPINRICAVFLFNLGLWNLNSFSLVMPGMSDIFLKITILSRACFPCLFLVLSMVFACKDNLFGLKKNVLYTVISVFLIVLIYKQWSMTEDLGYVYRLSGGKTFSVWSAIFYLYYLSFMGQGIYQILDYMEKSDEENKKKQAKIIAFNAVISMLIISLINMILPEWGIRVIPEITNAVMLVWGTGILYAILKYRFLVITPKIAVKNIISTMTDSMIIVDQSKNIVEINNAAVEMLGYKREELIGKPLIQIIFSGTERNTVKKMINRYSRMKNYEIMLIPKRGSKLPVLMSSSFLLTEKNIIFGTVLIAKDISQLKKTQKEKDKLREKLFQMQKMEAIATLSAGLAHQFNNVLCNIKGYSDLILMDIKDDNPIYNDVLSIKNNTAHAVKLIEDLYQFIQKRPSVYKPLDLNKLIINLRNKLTDCDNIEFKVELVNSVRLVNGDGEHIERAIKNILKNSCESITGNGCISIKTANQFIEEKTRLKNPDMQPGNFVEVSIADDGCGIDNEILDRIFDPFFTTKRESEAKGLGLFTAFGIVRQHGGWIEVKTDTGKGTEFTMFFRAQEMPLKLIEEDCHISAELTV